MLKKALTLALLIVILGCSSTQQSAATKPAPQSEFKNLEVIDPTIPRERLIETMRGFSRSLGVRCDHCHVVTATEPKTVFDFPADTKEEKRIARVMIQMVAQINSGWMPKVEAAEGAVKSDDTAPEPERAERVSCWTCHRGETEPASPPPPEPK